jgi:5-carboxyvanillate decarboxylase
MRFIGRVATRNLKKEPREYLASQFMITTSGMNDHPAFKHCHNVPRPEKLMFSSELREASDFMNSAPPPEADLEKIAHGNAERVFHVPAA